jgi:hypothetical protein
MGCATGQNRAVAWNPAVTRAVGKPDGDVNA